MLRGLYYRPIGLYHYRQHSRGPPFGWLPSAADTPHQPTKTVDQLHQELSEKVQREAEERAQRRRKEEDDDDFIDPGNPASPLSPLNPSHPASPFHHNSSGGWGSGSWDSSDWGGSDGGGGD